MRTSASALTRLSHFLVFVVVQCGALTIGQGSNSPALSAGTGLRLRNVLELISTSSVWKANLDEDSAAIYAGLSPAIEEKKGRPCVEDGIKKVQRLQLQLDRSDGRTDITPDKISDTYYTLLSICLRTEGGAWVAPLGPLQYVGFLIENFISVDGASRTIDVSALAMRMGQVLIDAPSPGDTSSPEATRLMEDIGAKLAVQDCLICLLRIAVRFAALKEQLEGVPPPSEDFSVSLSWPEAPSAVCSLEKDDVQFVLSCDFGDCDDSLTIPASVIKTWVTENALG